MNEIVTAGLSLTVGYVVGKISTMFKIGKLEEHVQNEIKNGVENIMKGRVPIVMSGMPPGMPMMPPTNNKPPTNPITG